jgi:hypothetical protein
MSDVTGILTGRINLKRNTSLLLDATTPEGSMSVDRQPQKSVRLEVEIDGASITNGLINVSGIGIGDVENVVIQDRTLATKWALSIEHGEILISSTIDNDQGEPVIEDTGSPGTYFKLFIDNGEIGIESTIEVAGSSILPGSNIVEQFLFDEDGVGVGESDFTSITGITLAGIDGGTIQVRAVNKMGQPVNQDYTIESNVPARFYEIGGRLAVRKNVMKQTGQEKLVRYKLMAEPDLDLCQNDLIFAVSGVFGITLGQVDFVHKIYDFDGVTHHTEAELVDI